MGFGEGMSYLNVNRDVISPKTRLWTQDANLDGPSDKTVAVLKFETPDGRQLAIKVFEDGKLVEEQLLTARPDGTIVKQNPDGTVLVSGTFQPDGKVVVRDEVRDLTLLAVDRDTIPDLTK